MTSRPFAYNPLHTPISGTKLIGDLSIGVSSQDYSAKPGGLTWWMGPNEDLGYAIGNTVPDGNQPTPFGNIGNVGFFITTEKTDVSFIDLFNTLTYQNFTTGDTLSAITWLNNNGYWTSYTASGSILFNGNTSSYITINNDIDLRFRSGDFTVEWFQYQTDSNPYPRPWTIGSWPNSNIGVSLEGGNFYFWYDGSTGDNIYNDFGTVGAYKNQWVHFAISRSGSTVKAFKNGTQIGSDFSLSYDFNNTVSTLCLGGEPNHSYNTASFGGYITNFRWIKGSALYTSNFSIPTSPLNATSDTKILILAANESNAYKDYSGLNKTINHQNTSWNSINPFYL